MSTLQKINMGGGWWKDFFQKYHAHRNKANSHDAYYGSGTTPRKVKTTCKRCLESRISDIQAREEEERVRGGLCIVRERDVIREQCEY